jgi:membrane-associated protease RseP (regulator of RpoE activity)
MKTFRVLASLVVLVAFVGAGCTSTSVRTDTPLSADELPPERVADTHYEAIIQRGPEYIDALRAQPAPERPEVAQGESEFGDQRALASEGFVRIGNARYAQNDAETLKKAIKLGQVIGADRMLLYTLDEPVEAESQPDRFLVAYYVRFKLLFGATFRNLTASERERLGVGGGVRIGSVVGDTPASQANLMAGDVVLAFNGKPIENRGAFQNLLMEAAGTAISLKVSRDGRRMDRMVRLGAKPEPVAAPPTRR